MNKFKFENIDKTLLPKTKGKSIDGHRLYAIDDKNYPSVTTVLNRRKKEGLLQWRKNVGEGAANWEMGRAARRGTATHTLIEQYIKGETPSERSVLPIGLFRLLKPYVDQVNNIHLLEACMYSHKLTIAGQVDCVAEYNGKLSVIDFKTSTRDKKEEWVENYFIQTTAYCEMFEEQYGKAINQIAILIVTEDGSIQTFIKDKKDYLPLLKPAIEEFHKKFKEDGKTN